VSSANFLRIDFKKKKLSATFADGSKKISPIVNLEKIDGKMVLTASGDAVAFVMFGACTLP
jgi:hypothetical protein